ncbi:RNA polymerase sigma-70 factor [Caldimonas sp. KR1-144]|uniref:RNA polymerase sigma-70 factor n=1 Tax=Caldimonas sp. KR1-144 TaxID=3400911 RepID=UPI003C07313A
MTDPAQPDAADTPFVALRPRLFSIAYRMLGTRADAEDVLQDAWLRWHRADRDALQSAEAWLVTVVTRLAIDRLRAAQAEREAYVGYWLPEPLVDELDERTPEAAVELAGELSIALLRVLERLAPEERAAFLLRQVFDRDYDEIAAALGKSEAACRQLVHRASERVQAERPRFEVAPEAHHRLIERFVQAAQGGVREAMVAMLADEAQLIGDGGGKVPSFGHPLEGPDRIANLYWANWKHLGSQLSYRLARINGETGVLRYVNGVIESAQAFVTDGERIVAVYAIRNPDKLAHIEAMQ